MFLRCLLMLALTVAVASAIQRPGAKSTLRGLARLPAVESRFTIQCDSDRGFHAFLTEKDPGVAAIEKRASATGSATDGKLFLETAALRLDAGDLVTARRDFQRAADLLRRRLDAEPGHEQVKLDLASALHGLGRASEAESILREAVSPSQASSAAWSAFASFLHARAWEIAADTANWRGRRPFTDLCHLALRREPSAETFDRSNRLLDEGVAAARHAAALDEKSAIARHVLAMGLASRQCLTGLRRRSVGKDLAPPPLEFMIFSQESVPHLRRAAELDTENPVRLATSLLWSALGTASDRHLSSAALGQQPLWESLPGELRRSIEDGLVRLGGFDHSASAGAAGQAVGILRYVLQKDHRGAADALRNAISSIPESEQLWEALWDILNQSDDAYELATIAQARAIVRPSVRNRVLLAMAFEKLGHSSRAIEELTAALALNANDFAANLSLATLLMRHSGEEVPTRVRQALVNAERALRSSGTGSQFVDLALAQSIYHGLTDDLERARAILKAAQEYAKNDPAIAAALNAIGY